MGLDISTLETFVLVADLESFSEAAKTLGVSQPAVSFQIKSLEKELGAPLLDRGTDEIYKRGSVPDSRLDADWIDFSKYGSVC